MNVDLLHTLIQDESFIEWVHSDFEKHDATWSRYIDENPDQFEEINQAISKIRLLHGEEFVFKGKDILFEKIESSLKIKPLTSSKTKVFAMRSYVLYAASVVVLLIVSTFYLGRKTIETEIGQQLVVVLPDDSKVTLNTKSILHYNQIWWKVQRNVQLTGEAFFEVTKGQKFTVKTLNGNVSVLGTSFNVLSVHDNFDVFCYTGKVAVSHKKNNIPVILTPNKGISIQPGKSPQLLEEKAVENLPDWTSGKKVFNDVPLHIAIAGIQKYFNQTIVLDDEYKNLRITAHVSIQHLDKALQTLTWPLGLQYKIEGEKVMISK
ncbi:MAG: FecR domain-containing protein [Saprospiraceae bacterium]